MGHLSSLAEVRKFRGLEMLHRWLAAGAIQQGSAHARVGVPVQDGISIDFRNGVVCVALADGAGSKRFSHLGAQEVTRGITDLFTSSPELLKNMRNEEIARSVETRVNSVLNSLVDSTGFSTREFASTLLFMAIRGGEYVAGHLGDGLIAYVTGRKAKTLSHPEHGEFINETFMTTSKNWIKHLRIQTGKIARVKSFILMSDGTAECMYERKTMKLANALIRLTRWVNNKTTKEMEDILSFNLENQIGKRTHDDVSILFLVSSAHTAESLAKQPVGFAKEYLGVSRKDGLHSRLRVISCLHAGMRVKDIATHLEISERSVYRHLKAMRLLGMTIH